MKKQNLPRRSFLNWPEDEKAGKMNLPDVLSPYVSASPVSLDIL